MGIDAIDVAESRQGRFHFFSCIRFEPFHVCVKNHVNAAARDTFAKSIVSILTRNGRHQAFKFDNFSFSTQSFFDPFACRATDFLVVGSDEAGVVGAQDPTIQHNNRNAGFHSLGDWTCEWLRFLWADDNEVDPSADEFLDV